MSTRLRHRVTFMLFIALLVGGCATGGTIYVIPLESKRMSAREPLVEIVRPDRCYYWVNGEGDLCVAARAYDRSIFGSRFAAESTLSFVLDAPPQGQARDYRVHRGTARHRFDAGLTHHRTASLSGIASVWRDRWNRVRVRFRFTATRQSYNVLVGWGGNRTVFFTGQITAHHNPRAGQAILQRIEAGPLARPAKPPMTRNATPGSSGE